MAALESPSAARSATCGSRPRRPNEIRSSWVVGSAGVFALVHLPAYGVAAMPVDLGAALLLSWQRYASGRWTVPAVTHAVANLLAVT